MQTIKRKVGDFNDLNFEVDLTNYGKVGADVAEITFLIKEDKSDIDADAIVTKTKTGGKISHTGTSLLNVLVEWSESEYGPFTIGNTYIAGLFIKFTGDPNHDEHTDDLFHITISEGFIQA